MEAHAEVHGHLDELVRAGDAVVLGQPGDVRELHFLEHADVEQLLGRRGRPDEIASAVVWLAGPGGRYVTGQTLHINGGAYLGG